MWWSWHGQYRGDGADIDDTDDHTDDTDQRLSQAGAGSNSVHSGKSGGHCTWQHCQEMGLLEIPGGGDDGDGGDGVDGDGGGGGGGGGGGDGDGDCGRSIRKQ